MFSQQFERMSKVKILGKSCDRATEFIVITKPRFSDGDFGFEYDIKISDSALYMWPIGHPALQRLRSSLAEV